MRILYSLIAFTCSTAFLYGTPQSGDVLVSERSGKKEVFCFALSENAQKALAVWKEQNDYRTAIRTDNGDGFWASLLLKDKKLYVTSLAVDVISQGGGFLRANVPLEAIFGSRPPTFADWFTGELREFHGEAMVDGTGSNVRIYRFKEGTLTKIEKIKTRELYK